MKGPKTSRCDDRLVDDDLCVHRCTRQRGHDGKHKCADKRW